MEKIRQPVGRLQCFLEPLKIPQGIFASWGAQFPHNKSLSPGPGAALNFPASLANDLGFQKALRGHKDQGIPCEPGGASQAIPLFLLRLREEFSLFQRKSKKPFSLRVRRCHFAGPFLPPARYISHRSVSPRRRIRGNIPSSRAAWRMLRPDSTSPLPARGLEKNGDLFPFGFLFPIISGSLLLPPFPPALREGRNS